MNHTDESRPRIIPALARIEPTRKPTKAQKLKARRQITAWQEKRRKDKQEK